MLTKTEGSSLFVAHGNVQPLWKTSLMVSQKTNGGSEGKPFAYNVGDLGSIPGMGRSPGLGRSWRRAWQPTPVFLPGESPRTAACQAPLSMGIQTVAHD